VDAEGGCGIRFGVFNNVEYGMFSDGSVTELFPTNQNAGACQIVPSTRSKPVP
jgi:hypothetical protein